MSPVVRIVQLAPVTLEALAAGDLDRARRTSSVPLTEWLAGPDCRGTWRYRAAQVRTTPADLPWVTGALRSDDEQVAVGKAGFHAAPDADGVVEAGYAVDPAHRRRGYARAALELMIERAREDPMISTFRLTVSPTNTASLGLVAQYPFVEVGEQWDEEDGLETIYEMSVASGNG